jgi:hypothetical protein
MGERKRVCGVLVGKRKEDITLKDVLRQKVVLKWGKCGLD